MDHELLGLPNMTFLLHHSAVIFVLSHLKRVSGESHMKSPVRFRMSYPRGPHQWLRLKIAILSKSPFVQYLKKRTMLIMHST